MGLAVQIQHRSPRIKLQIPNEAESLPGRAKWLWHGLPALERIRIVPGELAEVPRFRGSWPVTPFTMGVTMLAAPEAIIMDMATQPSAIQSGIPMAIMPALASSCDTFTYLTSLPKTADSFSASSPRERASGPVRG